MAKNEVVGERGRRDCGPTRGQVAGPEVTDGGKPRALGHDSGHA